MINEQTMQGNWNEIKGKLRNKWGQLTEDDLQKQHGNVEQLIGMIQRKTGEARESIEKFFDGFESSAGPMIGHAADTVRRYAHDATESVQQGTRQAADTFRESYADAEALVRERPAESIAVCFGVGLITGVVVGLLLRSN